MMIGRESACKPANKLTEHKRRPLFCKPSTLCSREIFNLRKHSPPFYNNRTSAPRLGAADFSLRRGALQRAFNLCVNSGKIGPVETGVTGSMETAL